MATTFNDALQEYNVSTSSTTNINEGNIVIPEGSETLSDLIKLNYDFKDMPIVPNDRSYNIYIWNNNTDGEIRFYTKDAKNNNNFNKNVFSGSYNEPRLNFNTKIGKDGKLYYWYNYNLLLPSKLSGWYSVVDDIYGLSFTQQNADIIISGLTAGLISTNAEVNALATSVVAIGETLVVLDQRITLHDYKILNLESLVGTSFDYTRYIDNIAERNGFNQAVQTCFEIFNDTNPITNVKQIEQIVASTTKTRFKINFGNNVANTLASIGFGAVAVGAIATILDEAKKSEYNNDVIKINDTLGLMPISSANNIINHTRITRLSGANDFPLTNNEFLIPIQRNAILRIGIDNEGIAYIIVVEQIGNTYFSVNETITINRNLLNGSGGNLVLNVASLGTLKEWTELKTTYLQTKISNIDTKNRRKAKVIGYDDINPTHFTKVDVSYTDNDGNISETIPYKTLEINPNYKSPTAIQADSATNANTAAVAVKLQTKRKIANVDFDGTANIDISYNNLTDKPTSFSGNIGIGTTSSASYNLDIYNQSTARIRIQSSSDFGATSSIEFRKGVVPDVWSDYRLINDNGIFKLQYENNDFAYADATNITTWSRVNVINNIQTQFNANVGIGTIPSVIATYKLDVFGDIKATAFRGDGANITNLNENNLVLTTQKIYEKCEPKTFIINPGDKIDIPPVYSFNITAFDRLANTTATYLEAGKFTCTYEDRNGTYKLIPSYIPNTNNKVLLNYRIGDKITFKHTANTQFDYQETPVVKWARLSLFKMPSGTAWNSQGMELYMTSVFDWDSDLTTVVDWTSGYPVSYPRNTPVTMQIEAGFKYFFVKWQRNNQPITFDSYITPATELSGMNIAYGGGQGFKISGDYSGSGGYKPISSSMPPLMTADTEGTARRGSRLSIDNGVLSADIPTGIELITGMNTAHFENVTTTINGNTTNKIGILQTYKHPLADKATKLETSRKIANVDFDGTGNIDIPYFNLTNKLTAGSGISITAGSATTSPEISATAQTPTSASLVGILNTTQFTNNTGTSRVDISSSYVAPKATILETSRNIAGVGFDGSGAIAIPYDNLTFKPTAGTNITITAGSSTLSPIINATSQAPTSASLVGILNTTQFVNNTGTSRVDISSTYVAPKATILETSRNIAGVGFNGSSPIDIPYFNTTFKPTVGNGLAITAGSATASPNITLNLSASGDIAINTGVNPATIGVSYTSANLIGAFNTTDFVNTASKITLSNNTSNYVARVNSELTTAIAATQPKIISTAGQIIIGNGDGLTTTSTGLTWTSGTTTLNATNLTTANLSSTQATITKLLTAGLDADMFILANNATNSLRFNQVYQALNDQKWILKQKSNNIDYNLFNFRNGKIAVGTQANPAYMLDVVGDVNITGDFLKNANVYKPANAVLADSATTATKLATGRNIAGVLFDGTGDIAIDYFSLNSKPIILQPTTTNLQLVSGYTFAVPGNVCIGSTAIATNVLQVGAGGRLRISNGTTDYTLLGTIDTDGATNTSIVISGTTRTGNAGNIQYLATASGGSHIFYTTSATTRMTISSSGVNINDNLGVLNGRVGIGTAPHATYKLDVLGDINVSGAFRVGGVALANSWSVGTPSTTINYGLGNVGIGNTAPTGTLCLGTSQVAGSDGFLLIGKNNGAGGARTQRIGYNTNFDLTIGDYGGGTGPWVEAIKFSYAAPANSLVVNGSGYVGIGTATPSYKCHIKCNYDQVATGLHLDASDSSQYTLTIWPYVQGGGQVGWRFRTISLDGGTTTPLQFYHNGNALMNGLNVSSLYSATTIQASGAIYTAVDLWNKSNDGKDRLYYANNGGSYIRSGTASGRMITFRNGSDVDIGYFESNIFYCYGPINLSDRRIKRDIVEINDETALNMILQVQPTTYYYRDETRNRGNGKVYGFIAQQIKEVIPDAVHTTKDIIANIYKTCLIYNKREIYHSIPQDIAIDTEVMIYDKEGGEKGKRYKIKEIYDDYFVIDEDIDGDDCFVFGYMVDDLNALDKSYIFTLNVCATQELHRRMEAQNVIIKSQDERIKELELKVERLLNYLTL